MSLYQLRLLYLRQKLRHHAFSLPQIAAAKQIQVVQDMIQIIKRLSKTVTAIQRPLSLIGRIKIRAKAAKQLGHRQIGFPVAVIAGGVKNNRTPLFINSRITRP